MFRTVAGLASAPGMAQAGLGMLGGAMRAIDPAEKMFRAAAPAVGGMLGLGAAGGASADGAAGRGVDEERRKAIRARLIELEDARGQQAGMTPDQLKALHEERINLMREMGVQPTYQRNYNVSQGPGMLEMAGASDWLKPKPRPSGAGDRRDKRLRDAEDADTKTS